MTYVDGPATRTRRGTVLLGAASLILLAIVGYSYQEWSRYRNANADTIRTTEIWSAVEQLQSMVLDAETGQRGFLLTGSERYLEPYNRAVAAVPAQIAKLNALLAQRPSQAANAARLGPLVAEKMAELKETIDLRRVAGKSPALDLVLSDRGKRTMDQIRDVLAATQSGETAAQRQASLDREAAAQTALLVTTGGSLLLLLLLVAGVEPILSRDPRAGRGSRWRPYAAAVAATLLSILLRMALSPLIGPTASPFVLFFPSVLFAAWYGGFRPGLLTVLLAALTAAYFFLPPAASLRVDSASDRIGLLIFVFVGTGIALLAHSQRTALERADREAARRWAAENAEREQRQRFETTLASIGDAVVATDAQGRIAFANQVARGLLRYPEDALLGRPLDSVFRILNEETRKPVESPVAQVLRQGGTVGLANHTVLIAADGAEIPIDDSAAPIRGVDGRTTGVVLVFRDISARREAERLLAAQAAEIREREEQFRVLANAVPQLVWMAHADGWVFWYNDRWFDYTGSTYSQMEGWGWQSIHDPEALPGVLEKWRAALSTGEPFELTFPLRGADAKFRTFLTRAVPVRDSSGRLVRWFGTCTDITEQHRVEDALRESERRLERFNAELVRSNEDLERFAFVASHDLQEPLRMISIFAERLARKLGDGRDGDAGVFLGEILDGATRMRELLIDLLSYTAIGSDAKPRVERVDLNALIDQVKHNLKAVIEESGAVIEADSLPDLRADAAHFVPLFQNLIANAIKYRGERPPRIRISVERHDDELRFAIRDNGIGIDPEFHQKVFTEFKRLHGREIPGTGLGLAICRRAVERYGGRIWVESQPGDGATFYFTLPEIGVQSAGQGFGN